MHKEESIPIPQPFVAYFSTLVATQLEDRKYDWIVPTYMDVSALTSFDNISSANGQIYTQPMIPHMLALLATFGMTDSTALSGRINDMVYTPVDLSTTAPVQLFNSALTFGNGTVTDRHLALAGCGTAYPFRFHNTNYDTAASYIQDTNFYGTKGIRVGATTTTGLTEDGDFSKLDKFLNLHKDKNPRWFDYLKEQMMIFSKHWKVQTNLSEIPTVGGLENTIICKLRTESEHRFTTAPTQRHEYASTHLDYAHNSDIKWNQQKFRNMTATFRTTRAGTERAEELQALAFGTNSLPPIAGLNIEDYRTGPFFSHYVDSTISQIHGKETDHEGKEMFAGWRTTVFAPMFVAKPEN
jgi:hypothetical protein